MLSNFTELKTVKVSRSPTTVDTANGEVRTEEEATRNWSFSTHWPFFHSENSAKITGTPTIGPVVRNYNSSKMADE